MDTDNLSIHRNSHDHVHGCHPGCPPCDDPQTVRIVDHLTDLSSGLLVTSESDYPLDVFSWPDEKGDLSAQRILDLTGHMHDTPIEETTVDNFFRPAVEQRDDQTDDERATAQRFRALVDGINEDLTDVHVYRVGTIAIDVYIVGHAPDGTLVGLSSKVIET
jgi:hypothetical protein